MLELLPHRSTVLDRWRQVLPWPPAVDLCCGDSDRDYPYIRRLRPHAPTPPRSRKDAPVFAYRDAADAPPRGSLFPKFPPPLLPGVPPPPTDRRARHLPTPP